ncbi:Ribosomal protein L30E [Methanonatronarchaeum thermophilum]|uniref:Large ribosomal subunit protein eL30 n=1 Tax=Methanonatronarchaeum thermophilum TaxID=1927129 RepID=A0A1Y3GF50_9EURY|nr:50S ribosomal protein L30e [Methanonatronarchaeum thermophilum]OUJ18933.1 Ribosomal protein L30E [Methanonatronarchaeum thermophilum]
MDFEKAIEDAIHTGKVKIGSNETIKTLEEETAELIITANNCPKNIDIEITQLAKEKGIKIIELNTSNYELGALCGRPHSVAALSIIDPGKSRILGVQELTGEINE